MLLTYYGLTHNSVCSDMGLETLNLAFYEFILIKGGGQGTVD